jgi:hypothetical protein
LAGRVRVGARRPSTFITGPRWADYIGADRLHVPLTFRLVANILFQPRCRYAEIPWGPPVAVEELVRG